jgi:hypothetical protein
MVEWAVAVLRQLESAQETGSPEAVAPRPGGDGGA